MKPKAPSTSEELFHQAALQSSRLLAQAQSRIIRGDNGTNHLSGDSEDDEIYGYGGRDWLYGGYGNDTLYGGGDGDHIYGQDGNDDLYGEDGDDYLAGGDGDDKLYGGRGDDEVDGGRGNDTYLFDAAFGLDEIAELEGHDRIEFTAHRRDQIAIQREYGELLLVAGSNDIVHVESFFDQAASRIESIRFADQTELSLEDIWAQFEQPNAQHINGSGKLHGSRFHDVLNGQNGDDFLYGYRGDDILRGGQGNDVLGGDDGNDVLEGGDGNDVLLAGEGDDILDGGSGDDELNGGRGNDTYRFVAAFGWDEIWNWEGADRIEFSHHKRADVRFSRGSADHQDRLLIDTTDGSRITVMWHFINPNRPSIDSIRFADGSTLQAADFLKPYLINGNAGHNTLHGSFGHDEMYGRNGNDKLYAREGDDVLYGGHGNDVLDGGSGSDQLYGDAGNDQLYGRDGNDRLSGGAGDDKLYAGHGNDVLDGGSGYDQLYGDVGNDQLYGREQNDLLSGGAGEDVLYGGSGNDKLYGGSDQDKLYGDEGNDQLYGDAGNDLLSGGAGNDRLFGGTGSDVLYGGAGKDTFVFDSVLGGSNVDIVKDFSRGTDLLALGKSIFGGLGSSIEAAEFGLGSSAANSSQRILFNQADGKLYYDADGLGGGVAVHFATLQGTGLNQLDHTSFSLI
ncbi:MAG: calcium-binding protein [Eikenella sp.]|nr:calcium-binding protein [Eikenella sp.]